MLFLHYHSSFFVYEFSIKCCVAQPVEKAQISAAKGKKIFEDILILSCEEDQATCLPFLEKGIDILPSFSIL